MMRVLSLFAGIGGFDLGLERTGGFKTVAFCEIDPFCQRVLAKHWPGVPIYDDVRELTAARLAADGIAADVITGGFPCQDVSVAGKRAGLGEGTRSGLWSEYARLVGELRPTFVIMENVAGLLSGPDHAPGGWFGRVLGDLAELGYDAEWENIPASALGAPHRRERVWVIAHPPSERLQGGLPIWPLVRAKAFSAPAAWNDLPADFVTHGHDGLPRRVVSDRGAIKALGNAVVPQIPEMIGRAILAAEAGRLAA